MGDPQGAPRLVVIRARSRWLAVAPSHLRGTGPVLRRFVQRDVVLRYRQTLLGVSWVILQPLLGAGLLTVVFNYVAGIQSPSDAPYFVVSYAGLVAWNLFAGVLVRSTGSLVANAGLVGKVFFPRVLLPASTVGTALLDALVALVFMGVLIAASSTPVTLAIVTLPLWIMLAAGLGLSFGVGLSAMAVSYRDVGQVVPVLVQLALFASPVAYSLASVPQNARLWFELNPMTSVLEGFRWSLVDGPPPSLPSVAWTVVALVIAGLVSVAIFSRMERRFADVI